MVLDGFDFGVGIVHRVVARTEDERRTVLAAIDPVHGLTAAKTAAADHGLRAALYW